MALSDDLRKLGEGAAASCGISNPRAAIDQRMEEVNDAEGWTAKLTQSDPGKKLLWGGKSLQYKQIEDQSAMERKAFCEGYEQRLKRAGKWTPELETVKRKHDAARDGFNRETTAALGAQGLWDSTVMGVSAREHFERDPSLEAESRKQWADARKKCGRDPNTGWGDPTNNVEGKTTGKPPRNLSGGGGFWSKLFGG